MDKKEQLFHEVIRGLAEHRCLSDDLILRAREADEWELEAFRDLLGSMKAMAETHKRQTEMTIRQCMLTRVEVDSEPVD